MISSTHHSDTKPWYQHRWPWILIAMPAASVVLGVILITTALRNPAILVVDNYYAEGRGINQSLAMDYAAQELGLEAQLVLTGDRMTLQLTSTEAAGISEDALRLYVYHATHEERDQEFVLLPALQQNLYEIADPSAGASLNTLLASQGSWYLELRGADNEWRLRKRVQTPLTQAAL